MRLPDFRRSLLAACLVVGTLVTIAGCIPGAGAPTAAPLAAPAGAPAASQAPAASAAPYAPKPGYNY